jgi:hypothetical protein
VFFELVTADIVLVDVSVFNPNVFYELGVRHGVTPRGTILVSGGWNGAPVRHLAGPALRVRRSALRGRRGMRRADAAVAGARGRAPRPEPRANHRERPREAVEAPVFSALPGLKPVDWSRIENARAQYFNVVIDALSQRVQTARAGGLAGGHHDPRGGGAHALHEKRLLMEAARGLTDLHRLDPAREQIESAPRDRSRRDLEGRVQLAMVLNRLDRSREGGDPAARTSPPKLRPTSAC